jgi:ABC-type uncharacterized transport system involved in gliding motility auxiliary subunit
VANNVGDELHANIRAQSTLPRTVVPRAKPINVTPRAGERTVSPVLRSSPASWTADVETGEHVAQGPHNLLAVAQRTRMIDNNPHTSLFLVSGSFEFLAYLPDNGFANSDILLNAMRVMTNKRIVVDINWKRFDSNALNMELHEQNRWMLITIFLMPSLVSLAGIIVWLKRRHS